MQVIGRRRRAIKIGLCRNKKSEEDIEKFK